MMIRARAPKPPVTRYGIGASLESNNAIVYENKLRIMTNTRGSALPCRMISTR